MRKTFIASFLANVALALVSLTVSPGHVAIHFGPGGTPDGWASNTSSTLIMLGIHILVFCSLYFSPKLLETVPRKWISLPNRDYWLQPERRSHTMVRFRRHIWQFGTAIFLFMFFAGLLTLRANLSDPVRLDERLFLVGLVIFLAYTVYWVVALLRAFRVPKTP